MHCTLSAVVALSLSACTTGPLASQAQVLELRIHLDKRTYFEDEPIYVLFELHNPTQDTVWVKAPFDIEATGIRTELRIASGEQLYESHLYVNYVLPAGWRGEPVPPGDALYEVNFVQQFWTDGPRNVRRFPSQHLPIGDYEMSAWYVPDQRDPTAVVGRTAVRFSIRERDASEDRAVQALWDVVDAGFDPQRRGGYFAALIGFVRQQLAGDSAAPLVPIALHNGYQLAMGVGLRLPGRVAQQLTELTLAAAGAQRSQVSGVMAIDALHAHEPDHEALLTFVQRFPNSLAARYARSRPARVP